MLETTPLAPAAALASGNDFAVASTPHAHPARTPGPAFDSAAAFAGDSNSNPVAPAAIAEQDTLSPLPSRAGASVAATASASAASASASASHPRSGGVGSAAAAKPQSPAYVEDAFEDGSADEDDIESQRGVGRRSRSFQIESSPLTGAAGAAPASAHANYNRTGAANANAHAAGLSASVAASSASSSRANAGAADAAGVNPADVPECTRGRMFLGIGGLIFFLLCALITFIISEALLPASPRTYPAPDVTILAFNDIYELNPIAGYGGAARLPSIRAALLAEPRSAAAAAAPVTGPGSGFLTLFAGDVLSPTALNSVRLQPEDTEPLNGKHMMDIAVNKLGVDYATLGNHEFDFGVETFYTRMAESTVPFVATNVYPTDEARPFPQTSKAVITERANGIRIGIIAPVVDDNQPDYVTIDAREATVAAVKAQIQSWRDAKQPWDILLLLSHIDIGDDLRLLEEVPEIDLIVGGHDHDRMQYPAPSAVANGRSRYVAKADSNLESVYVHRLSLNPKVLRASVGTEYGTVAAATAAQLEAAGYSLWGEHELVTDKYPLDAAVQTAVDDWTDKAFAALEQEGFDPRAEVAQLPRPLDVTETTVRFTVSEVGAVLATGIQRAAEAQLAADARADAAGHAAARARRRAFRPLASAAAVSDLPPAQFGLANAGCLRLEGLLPAATVSQYDAMRTLPFGGTVMRVNATGAAVSAALETATERYRGRGGWMAYDPTVLYKVTVSAAMGDGEESKSDTETTATVGETKVWSLYGSPLEAATVYTFNINDYLVNPSDIFPEGSLTLVSEEPVAASIQVAFAEELGRRFPLPKA